MRLLLVVLFLVPHFALAAPSERSLIGNVVRVVDGDTFVVVTEDGLEETVRLWGIDAPEIDQPYGNEAKTFLTQFISGRTVTVHWETRDWYGRIIGFEISPTGLGVNHPMVGAGYAWWFEREAANDQLFRSAQIAAKEMGLGLWAEIDPVPPWEWRTRGCADLVAESEAGNLDCVQLLLAEGVDPNSRDDFQHSALRLASANGHFEEVVALLAAGADPRIMEPNATSALLEASRNGFADIVDSLLRAGASTSYSDSPSSWGSLNFFNSGDGPIAAAAMNGHLEVVKTFLHVESDRIIERRKIQKLRFKEFIETFRDDPGLQSELNLRNYSPRVNLPHPIGGMRALSSASENGFIEIVELLLDVGVDVDTDLRRGMTALVCASFWRNESLVEYLLNEGACADARTEDGASALLIASQNGSESNVRALLKAGADVNQSGGNGMTPTMMAANNGHSEIVSMLLESGAEVDANDRLNRTALMYAVTKNVPQYVVSVVRQGADGIKDDLVDSTSEEDATIKSDSEIGDDIAKWVASRIAIEEYETFPKPKMGVEGRLETVEALVNAGADVHSKSITGFTTLMLASEIRSPEIVRLLIDQGGNLQAHSDMGWTPLLAAAYVGNTDTVRLLIGAGANVDEANDNGETSLIVASMNGHLETVVALLDSGADPAAGTTDGKTALQYAMENGHESIVSLLRKRDLE